MKEETLPHSFYKINIINRYSVGGYFWEGESEGRRLR
jgi:hypothetical protein